MTSTRLDLTIADDLAEIGRIAPSIDDFCAALGHGPDVAHAINLSLDELLTNTISYGYDSPGPHEIAITLVGDARSVTVTVTDDAVAFDPTQAGEPDLDAELDDRPIGGLGIHIVRVMMDDIVYRHVDGHNQLILTKRTGA